MHLPIATLVLVSLMVDSYFVTLYHLLGAISERTAGMTEALGLFQDTPSPAPDIWSWPGWTAVEAIGSILAVFSAIGLAYWAATQETRRVSAQRRKARYLLSQEIRNNLESLDPVLAWLDQWYAFTQLMVEGDKAEKQWHDITHDPLPEPPGMTIHRSMKDRLGQQLPVFSQAFDLGEMDKIDDFYLGLESVRLLLEEYQQTGPDVLLARLQNILAGMVRSLDKLALQRKGIDLVKRLEAG